MKAAVFDEDFVCTLARDHHDQQGHDHPPRPCTFCNKCLFAFVENPLGCYDERRYGSREEMIREVFSVYEEAA